MKVQPRNYEIYKRVQSFIILSKRNIYLFVDFQFLRKAFDALLVFVMQEVR